MASITETARKFFEACEAGKGWDACRAYCKPNATFAAQAEPLAQVQSLEQYTEWMKGLLGILPDGRYELRSCMQSSSALTVAKVGRARLLVKAPNPTTCTSWSSTATRSDT